MADSVFWVIIICLMVAIVAVALAMYTEHKEFYKDVDHHDGSDNWHKTDFEDK